MTRDRFQLIVLGLPRRADRRVALVAELARVPAPPPVFAADEGIVVDWRDWTGEQIEALRPRVFPWRDPCATEALWNRHLKLGEIACTLSHWNVWTYAAAQDPPGIVILEDDASLDPGFAEYESILDRLTQLDPAWDVLFLGRWRARAPLAWMGEFVRPGYSYCTYGYAISRSGLAKLLATDLPNGLMPIDEFLAASYIEHPREGVGRRFRPILSAYGMVDDVVHQKGKLRCGSDGLESPLLLPVSEALAGSVAFLG